MKPRHVALVALLAAAPPVAAAPPAPGPAAAQAAASAPRPVRLRPPVARLVRVLARQARIETSHVGPSGDRSRPWATFDAVRAAATPAELAALLEHPSPIVRGYVARYVLRTAPTLDLVRMRALLRDTTVVRTLDGCDVGASSLGLFIAEHLFMQPADPLGDALLRVSAAADPSYPEDVRALIARWSR